MKRYLITRWSTEIEEKDVVRNRCLCNPPRRRQKKGKTGSEKVRLSVVS